MVPWEAARRLLIALFRLKQDINFHSFFEERENTLAGGIQVVEAVGTFNWTLHIMFNDKQIVL